MTNQTDVHSPFPVCPCPT